MQVHENGTVLIGSCGTWDDVSYIAGFRTHIILDGNDPSRSWYLFYNGTATSRNPKCFSMKKGMIRTLLTDKVENMEPFDIIAITVITWRNVTSPSAQLSVSFF